MGAALPLLSDVMAPHPSCRNDVQDRPSARPRLHHLVALVRPGLPRRPRPTIASASISPGGRGSPMQVDSPTRPLASTAATPLRRTQAMPMRPGLAATRCSPTPATLDHGSVDTKQLQAGVKFQGATGAYCWRSSRHVHRQSRYAGTLLERAVTALPAGRRTIRLSRQYGNGRGYPRGSHEPHLPSRME
jgi:hypothetical protein